jgi:hypothetical protein
MSLLKYLIKGKKQADDLGKTISCDTASTSIVTNVTSSVVDTTGSTVCSKVASVSKLQLDLNSDAAVQPKLKEYSPKPYTEKGIEKYRDFQYSWFVNRSWLEYSVVKRAAFCFPCRAFHRPDTKNCYEYDPTFVVSGFSNWKKAMETGRGIKKHEESGMHKRNMALWMEREKRIASGASVSTLLCDEQLQKNRYYLGCLIDVLQFIALNELPLRGDKRETLAHLTDSDENCDGLFLRLVQYTAKRDEKLAAMLHTVPKNASYTSPEIQNELLKEMAAMVVEQIVQKVKDSDIPFYTIKADGTQDKTWTENFSLVLRYVHDGVVQENLVALLAAKELHAEYLSTLILSTLEELGLDKNNILSQCYDGASVMSGCHGGVQALIQEKLGKPVPYTHCFNHQLHLVVVHTVSREPKVKSMFDICNCLYNFVRRPNVAAVYKGHKLTRLLEQRWSGHLDQLKVVTADYDDIINLLEYFCSSDECSADVRIDAVGLLNEVKKPMFCFTAVLMKQILLLLNPANQMLQAEKCDLLSAVSLITASQSGVKDLRCDDAFSQIIKDANINLSESDEELLPRKRPSKPNRR